MQPRRAFTLIEYNQARFTYFRKTSAAAYHGKSGNLSYADGHADLHPWKTEGFLKEPSLTITYGTAPNSDIAGVNNVDRIWLQNHSAQFSKAYKPIP